jgi:DeoR/GlpR family transcriptional regulator of sugar metabolism
VLADGSKFRRRGPVRLASAAKISTLITDDSAPDRMLAALSRQNVDIIRC